MCSGANLSTFWNFVSLKSYSKNYSPFNPLDALLSSLPVSVILSIWSWLKSFSFWSWILRIRFLIYTIAMTIQGIRKTTARVAINIDTQFEPEPSSFCKPADWGTVTWPPSTFEWVSGFPEELLLPSWSLPDIGVFVPSVVSVWLPPLSVSFF